MVNLPAGAPCRPSSPWWERGGLSPVFGGSSWELDVTQLPWDTETRAAHFPAVPIPERLEEGLSCRLSSRDGQLGNLLCPEVSPGILSKQKTPSASWLSCPWAALRDISLPLVLLRILFCPVLHCDTLSNKPS